MLHVRLSPTELADLRERAERASRTISDWARLTLLADVPERPPEPTKLLPVRGTVSASAPNRSASVEEIAAHPAIVRASELAAERDHVRPDPKPSRR